MTVQLYIIINIILMAIVALAAHHAIEKVKYDARLKMAEQRDNLSHMQSVLHTLQVNAALAQNAKMRKHHIVGYSRIHDKNEKINPQQMKQTAYQNMQQGVLDAITKYGDLKTTLSFEEPQYICEVSIWLPDHTINPEGIGGQGA